MGNVRTGSDRKRQQRELLKLFEVTLSDLVEGNEENFNILKEGNETQLEQLITKYELDLTLGELVPAVDGLIALAQLVDRIRSRWGFGRPIPFEPKI